MEFSEIGKLIFNQRIILTLKNGDILDGNYIGWGGIAKYLEIWSHTKLEYIFLKLEDIRKLEQYLQPITVSTGTYKVQVQKRKINVFNLKTIVLTEYTLFNDEDPLAARFYEGENNWFDEFNIDIGDPEIINEAKNIITNNRRMYMVK